MGFVQPRYDLLVKREYWHLSEAVSYLVLYEVNGREGTSEKEAREEFERIKITIRESVLRSIKSGGLKPNALVYEETGYFDEDGPIDEISLESRIEPLLFIKWAKTNSYKIPTEFSTHLQENQPETEPLEERYIFRKDGLTWHFAYGCKQFDISLKNHRQYMGLSYIAHIMQKAPNPVETSELLEIIGKIKPRRRQSELYAADGSTIREIRRKIDELDGKIAEELDDKKRSKYISESEKLKEYLSSSLKKNGLARRLDDPGEKDRKKVGIAITRAINQIASRESELAQSGGSLAIHLANTISPYQAQKRYAPEKKLNWEF